MKKLIAIAFAAVLAACASNDSKAKFLQAEAGYTAVLQLAANYAALPRCTDGGPKACSEQKIVDQIRPAANSADATVQAAEDLALSDNPPKGSLDMALQAAQAATASLSAILANYGIKGN